MISLVNPMSFRRFLLMLILGMAGSYTSLGQSYCKPSLGSCCEWISNVSLASLNHSTTNESGHADYTSVSTIVTKGTTYPISVRVSTNSIYVEHVKIYFDWDRDYIFETALYLGSAKFSGDKIYSGEVTVPATAKSGCSMMRVFMQYAQQPSGACSSLGDGEIEDYTVVVTNIAAPVADFTFPASPACVQSPIIFTNTSSVPENALMNYAWNFGDGTTSNLANPIKAYAAPGSYNVKLTSSTFCTTQTVTKNITVHSYPLISKQPVSAAVCSGGNTSFTVAANPGATFQWQVNKGSGFVDLSDQEVYTQTASSVLAIVGATTGMNGYQFRCVVSTSCTVISSSAVLTIQKAPVIVVNPVSASACLGGNTTFTVSAAGSGLSYQWQQDSGNGFSNLSNGEAFSNVTTETLSMAGIGEAYHNTSYRCMVTSTCTATTAAATLSIQVPVVIVSQPLAAAVVEGTNATFRTEGSGTGIHYQWQENAGAGFVNLIANAIYENVNSATLTIAAVPLSKNGYEYRCLIAGSCTSSLFSESKVLTVNRRLPIITSTAITHADEDESYTYTLTASDATGTPVTYSALAIPKWLSFDPASGKLTGIPTNGDVGIHTVTLSVSNSFTHVEQSFFINVINTNDSPKILSTPGSFINEKAYYGYTLIASDVDVETTLSYSAPEIPAWLTFNKLTHILQGTPSNGDVGVQYVTLRVSDGEASIDQKFTITVINVNDLPNIRSEPVLHADEDSVYRYTVSVEDADVSDHIVFSSSVKPVWLIFNEITGVLAGTPSNSDVGSHDVTLRVSDGHVMVDQSFTIIVKNINDAPAITSTPVATTPEDAPYHYLLMAVDVDRVHSLSYAVLEKPDWLSFNTEAHLLNGIPTNKDVGSFLIRLHVSDGFVDVDQNFTLEVSNVNDPPSITSIPEISVEGGVGYHYKLVADDVDLKDILYYAAVALPGWLTFNAETGILTGTPQEGAIGVYNVTLRVSDGSVQVDQSFSISVTRANAGPGQIENQKPTELTFSTKTFESSLSIYEALGIFTTVDADDTNHVYALVNGDGDYNNAQFRLENHTLYLVSSENISDVNQFSLRVKSTDSHGNFIEQIFHLEKVEAGWGEIQVPTTFSPDGDGINDTWVVKDLMPFRAVSIQVFDRSGVPVFTSSDPAQGWDGSNHGRILEGPFFYIIKIYDTVAVKKGVLIVIR